MLVHIVADQKAALEAFRSTKPFAQTLCGEVDRERGLTFLPFGATCPSCLEIWSRSQGLQIPGLESPTGDSTSPGDAAPGSESPSSSAPPGNGSPSDVQGMVRGFVVTLLDGLVVEPEAVRYAVNGGDPVLHPERPDLGDLRALLGEKDRALLVQVSDAAGLFGQEELARHLCSLVHRAIVASVSAASKEAKSEPEFEAKVMIPLPSISDPVEEETPLGDTLLDDEAVDEGSIS